MSCLRSWQSNSQRRVPRGRYCTALSVRSCHHQVEVFDKCQRWAKSKIVIVLWAGRSCVSFSWFLLIHQEEKLEDDPFAVNVPADPSECRLDAISYAIPVTQLHLLITARKLPWLPESHYKWWLLCWSKYSNIIDGQNNDFGVLHVVFLLTVPSKWCSQKVEKRGIFLAQSPKLRR